jgi:agmatinase
MIIGPIDPLKVPRYAGPSTFARLPTHEQVERADVAILGIPFDAGVTTRPGARFGPAAVRNASRFLRGYHRELEVEPFRAQQVADFGDIIGNPFNMLEALEGIDEGATAAFASGAKQLLSIGGDHTIALPLLRAMHRRHGPVALLHFDAHFDTWDTYFGAEYTHGTPFRRAWEEKLLLPDRCAHVGIRGPIYGTEDLADNARFGFETVAAMDYETTGIRGVVARLRERFAGVPVYISIDIDVLDPAHAPGTASPEAGGMTSRELLGTLRGLAGLRIVGGDVVEVSPPYDHADMTSVAASHACFELLALFARSAS